MKKVIPLLLLILLGIGVYCFVKPYLSVKKFFEEDQSYSFVMDAPDEISSLLEGSDSVQGEYVEGMLHATVTDSEATELFELYMGKKGETIINLSPVLLAIAGDVSEKITSPVSKLLSGLFSDGNLYISLDQIKKLTGDSQEISYGRFESLMNLSKGIKKASPKLFYKAKSDLYSEEIKGMKFVSLKSNDDVETIMGFQFLTKNALKLYIQTSEGGELYFNELKYDDDLEITLPETIDQTVIDALEPIISLFADEDNDLFSQVEEKISSFADSIMN